MKPGPKQKDFAVRRLGKPSQRAQGAKSGPMDSVIPSCPAFLSVTAKTEWKRVCAELSKVPGLLAAVDRACLTEYCLAWAGVREAELHLQKEGATMTIHGAHGYEVQQQSPWVGIQQGYLKSMRSAADRLGFSPASRSSIHLVSPKGEIDALTPPHSTPPQAKPLKPGHMVAGAGEVVPDNQQPTLSVEAPTAGASVEPSAAGAVVEEQPDTSPVDHPPVEDPAAGTSLNQQPEDPPVEPPTAGAGVKDPQVEQRLRAWCHGMSS